MKRKSTQLLLMAYDSFAVFLSLIVSITIYNNRNFQEIYKYTLPIIANVLLINIFVGDYYNIWKYAGFSEFFKHSLAVSIIGIALFLYKFIDVLKLSAYQIIIFCITYFFLTLLPRFWSRFCRWLYLNDRKKIASICPKKVMIIGAGYSGAALIEKMLTRPEDGLEPIVVIDDDRKKIGKYVHGIKVFGDRNQIVFTAKKYNIEQIIICIPSISLSSLRELYGICKECQVPIKILPNAINFNDYLNIGKNAIKNISIEDLLFRNEVHLDNLLTKAFILDKTVLVTGGAGSIGSEICRQVLANECKHLIIFDICENDLFSIDNELKTNYSKNLYSIVLGSVRDENKLDAVLDKYKPEIVLHAAAHKHVPLIQINPIEAIKNNVFGTNNIVKLCIKHNVQRFILISTDKAVNPVNIMGASKRFAELIVQAYNNDVTKMAAVRFGNVLGSAGSVIPLFKKQIEDGGPLTLTHPDMQRYFMTIPEAVALVLQTGAIAESGGIFMLDMGKPVKIYDLACDLIKLSGLRPHEDIEIKITGIRPGEKLYEELSYSSEDYRKTDYDKIFICNNHNISVNKIIDDLDKLSQIVKNENEAELEKIFFQMLKAYEKSVDGDSINDTIDGVYNEKHNSLLTM